MSNQGELNVLFVEHQAGGEPGILGDRLRAAHANLTEAGPHLETAIPENLDGFDALVVMGGSPGPTDDEDAPWLPHVRALIAEALEEEIPFLGICLGSQMLATVAGGRVASIDDGPEIGLTDIELTEDGRNDPLLSALNGFDLSPEPMQVIEWHWLEAKELPPGSSTLATSQACRNQAFRVGTRAWGLQFHPEVLARETAYWTTLDPEGLRRLNLDAQRDVIEPITAAESELVSTWSVLFDRWIELALAAYERTENGSA